MENKGILKFNIKKILITFLLVTILLLSLNIVNAYSNDDVNVSDNLSASTYDTIPIDNLNKDLSVNNYHTNTSDNLNSKDSGNNLLKSKLNNENSSSNNHSLNVNKSDLESTVLNYDGQIFNVTNKGNGHFVISQEGNNLTVYKFNVESEDDLKTISNIVKNLNISDDVIFINFINDINVTHFDNNVLFSNSRILSINGNGVRISSNKPDLHFLTSGLSTNVIINNLTLNGFNSSIINYGKVTLEDVNFVNNTYEPVFNYGNLECINCSFLNNCGKSSAGLYIANYTYTNLTNCIFKNNNLINNKSMDILVDNSIVYVFTLNGFNKKPIYKCLNDGKVIFKNTTKTVVSNLTINNSIEKVRNKVLKDKSEILNLTLNTSKYYVVVDKTHYLLHPSSKLLIINGNGAIINLKNHNDRGVDHFLICDKDVSVVINNLTIIGFNTAIYNYGNMILKDVTFKNNRMNYFHDINRGGAIINNGVLTCINCSFINNTASYGGAIFSNGSSSKLNLTNCFFRNNTAYKNGTPTFWKVMNTIENYWKNKKYTNYIKGGDDVLVSGKGIVFAYNLDSNSTPNSNIKFGWDDSEPTIVLRNSFEPEKREFVINDTISFKNVTSTIWNYNTKIDLFIINFTGNININPWSKNLFHLRYGALIINGNGGSVNVINPKINKGYHFAFVNQFSQLTINNLTLTGFNCALFNHGVLNLNNVILSNNKVKYKLEDDDAGAVYNLGLLTCYNCTFTNNYAKWAGAVYTAHGAESYFTLCDFINNTNYNSDGANIYNFNQANSFFINDNCNQNISAKYGTLPDKECYELGKVSTYIITCALTTLLTGNPCLGMIVAISVGSALDVVNDIYYAKATHQFSYSIFTHIPVTAWNHFLASAILVSGRNAFEISPKSGGISFPNIKAIPKSKLNPDASDYEPDFELYLNQNITINSIPEDK